MKMPAKLISMTVLCCLFLVNVGSAQNLPLPPRPLEPNETLPIATPDETTPAPSTYHALPETPAPAASSTTPDATTPAASSQGTAQPQPGRIGFVMHQPEVRKPQSGYEVGVYGGISTGITGDHWSLGSGQATSSGNVAPSGGIKFGYTWPFESESIDQLRDETGGIHLAGGIEGQLAYVGDKLKITGVDNGPTGAGTYRSYRVNLDCASFMINLLLKGQIDKFRLYAGPSFGFAGVSLDSYNYPGWRGAGYDVDFAYGILGGAEYFLDPKWSLFTEYQYVRYHNVSLSSGTSQLTFDPLEQNLVNVGVKYHF